MSGQNGPTGGSAPKRGAAGWRGGGGAWRGGGGGWRGRGGGGWRGRGGGGWRGRGWKSSQPSETGNSSTQEDITDYFELEPCPFLGWKHYLPDLPFSRASPMNRRLEAVMDYYR